MESGLSDLAAIETLRTDLGAAGTRLVYLPEVGSTMDEALNQGLTRSLVLTDHQTRGRGRYERAWEDDAGKSLLATFVRPIAKAALPPRGSLLLSHGFVLAVRQALGSQMIMIKWPNDLYIGGRKAGGVLLAEGAVDEERQAVLFGVGLNLYGQPEQDVAAVEEVVPEPRRNDILLAINAGLDDMIADLARIADPAVFAHYGTLWRRASWLTGKKIRITADGSEPLEGTVVGAPFGGNLQLSLSDGSIIEIKEYGRTARIEVTL